MIQRAIILVALMLTMLAMGYFGDTNAPIGTRQVQANPYKEINK